MRLRPLRSTPWTMSWSRPWSIALLLAAATALSAKDDVRLKDALEDDLVGAEWIYDDIGRGLVEARKQAKPLLVSFRCVP